MSTGSGGLQQLVISGFPCMGRFVRGGFVGDTRAATLL